MCRCSNRGAPVERTDAVDRNLTGARRIEQNLLGLLRANVASIANVLVFQPRNTLSAHRERDANHGRFVLIGEVLAYDVRRYRDGVTKTSSRKSTDSPCTIARSAGDC